MKKIGIALGAYYADGSPGNVDEFVEDRVKGEIIRLADGAYVMVTSVTNAGLNGLQIVGKLVDDSGRATDVTRLGYWHW